ncbi:MAG: hypothetical protein ACYSTL_07770, partial [Planctomycetota bacterium]
MSRKRRITITVLLAWASVVVLAGQDASGGYDEWTFQNDLTTLTANPHRLGGMADGSIVASKHVEDRLRQIGVDEIYIQNFPVIQPVTTQCELVADGKSYPINAMRPNILQAPVTPEEGITGTTMYVGRGEVPEYGSRIPEDKIVVMDFDSGMNWLNAFAFGARAVLFIAADKVAANPFHHMNLPANLPRFHVPGEVADALQLREAPRKIKLLGACEWREQRGRNVIAVLRGTD